MSYDIRIMKSEDPYGDPTEPLDAQTLIDAIDSFAPFVKHGITWSNQGWFKYDEWIGLVIGFEEYEPALAGCPCKETLHRGTVDACNVHITYGTSDRTSCLALALHIAEATGAKAWDLQLNRMLISRDLLG